MRHGQEDDEETGHKGQMKKTNIVASFPRCFNYLLHEIIKLTTRIAKLEAKMTRGAYKRKEEKKEHHHSKAAMKHPDKPGAGAAKRKKIKDPKTKVATVMEEFKHHTLHSGKSKAPVKNRKQAIAIAMSESGQSKKKK